MSQVKCSHAIHIEARVSGGGYMLLREACCGKDLLRSGECFRAMQGNQTTTMVQVGITTGFERIGAIGGSTLRQLGALDASALEKGIIRQRHMSAPRAGEPSRWGPATTNHYFEIAAFDTVGAPREAYRFADFSESGHAYRCCSSNEHEESYTFL